ncbi:MAG: hypothetical protein IJ646_07555 [Clostridia bacterium]|nr:hypothetical protein [Clostridia bacterium]
MDAQAALKRYIEAVVPEREDYLYKQALNKVRAITRGMSDDEREAYLQSRAFANVLYRARRADRTYQALKRGELVSDYHRDEFERLQPLIEREKDGPIDLEFLRSVDRSRVPIGKARRARRLIATQAPRRTLNGMTKKYVGETEAKVERYLQRADLGRWARQAQGAEQVAARLMETVFSKGVPDAMMEDAWQPKSLAGALQNEVDRAHPELRACGAVAAEGGERVSSIVKSEVQRAKRDVCARTRRRFPADRLRRLLSNNPSIRQMQRQSDQAFSKERRLRAVLVTAVPEHYRDLYPLARAMKRRFILHVGPTNSGKTHEGVGRLKGARNGIYLGPLRLLAAEQFETLNLSDVPCSLVTGEEQIWVPGSRVQSSTVEMADLKARYDVAVIDECQMIADRDRGGAWTAAILGLCAEEIHLCASPDAEELLKGIVADCGDDLTVVRHHRMTPLEVEKGGFEFPASVRRGDALIVFSKARVHAVAAELRRKGWRVSLIYGALPPDVRRDQAERFQQGDSEVVVSTDAIAMGMNLPIERVVFLESEKYDGDIVRPLLDSEIKQIAGRAGRYGQYETGYVNAFGFKGTVARALARPPLIVTEAVIGFPESLLGLPLPLTQIIGQWNIMKDKGCFSKASTVRMETLAAMLETRRTDKRLLYRFLCIPFDETDPELLIRWRAMYQAECHHEHIDVLAAIPELLDPEACDADMLDGLEADYRRCDLYYNYARLFLDDPEPVLDEIQRRKSLISGGIIHILSTQRLKQRACPNCNKYLPWNWPYKLCDGCYRQKWR